MNWLMISIILSVFGFLKEFRPSEPFVTNYLSGPWKNFTQDQINQEIYPIATYSNFATLIWVFLLTDLIRYKFAIIVCGLSGTSAYIILRFGTTIFHMQVVEFLYGLLLSTEVAYYTYIYAKVNKEHYQRVTSHTRGACLLGRFAASVVAQLIISFRILNFEQLNYITIASLGTATLWAFFLPSVNHTVYFHQLHSFSTETATSLRNEEISNTLSISIHKISNVKSGSFFIQVKHAYYLLWEDFVKAYTNKHVIKWSLWWAFATCGYLQVTIYIQLLWENTVNSQKKSTESFEIYNGFVEAVYTVISAIVVFGVGNLHLNWSLVGEVILSIFSITEGILLIISYINYNIWIQYYIYITFGVIYQSIITIISFEVIKNLSENSYGLIFGINTFFALTLQSLLTIVVVSKSCFNLDIRLQYLTYGGYFMVLGIIFMIMSIFTLKQNLKNKKTLKIWSTNDESVTVIN